MYAFHAATVHMKHKQYQTNLHLFHLTSFMHNLDSNIHWQCHNKGSIALLLCDALTAPPLYYLFNHTYHCKLQIWPTA